MTAVDPEQFSATGGFRALKPDSQGTIAIGGDGFEACAQTPAFP